MRRSAHMFFRVLILRLCYRHGFPFITSVALAVVITAWSRVREAVFHEGTSMWTFAILATISTAFALLCGGRFRTFFTAIAVTPPFLFALPWFLRSVIRHPEYPIKGFVEYFLYFVVAPILLVWIFATLSNRKKQSA
jgi:hypothetical protein